ncbi:MAG TPA: site-specific integrase [Candidatus Avirikenella pullistercoris]|nr:site-specific integrase [Candidatus Avirikenella pullistercoris]
MASVKLLLNKSRALRDGSFPLVFQLIHQRRKKLIYTPYKLYPEEFDLQTQKVRRSDGSKLSIREVRSMNCYLMRQRRDIDRYIRELESCKPAYSVSDILIRYRIAQSDSGLLHYMDLQIGRKQLLGKFGTAAAYQSTRHSIALFTGPHNISLRELDHIFIRDYADFLWRRGVGNNTICFYMRNLKAIYNQAAIDGYSVAKESPFRYLHIGPCKTTKRALDRKALRRIYQLNLTGKPHLELARDLFLFGFFTRGMPFVDILSLKKKNLRNGLIVYNRRKTDQRLQISLTPQLRYLIAKYENDTEFIFPVLSGGNPKEMYRQYRRALERVNRNLKEVARLAEIDTPLSMYVSRHSWASQAKALGAPIAVISESLGHTSEKTTQIYLKEFDQSVVDRVNALVSAL